MDIKFIFALVRLSQYMEVEDAQDVRALHSISVVQLLARFGAIRFRALTSTDHLSSKYGDATNHDIYRRYS